MNRILLIGLILLCGCAKEGLEEKRSNNPNFKVTFLFTNEGCSVYRFFDQWRSHYYVDCRGQTLTHVTAGKSSYPEEITTP